MGRAASVVRWGAWPLVLACAMAHAGPPFVTDDPEPVEPGRWEINTAATGSWHGGEAAVGLPSVDINYGAAPNVQLHAQPRFSLERAGDGTRHGIDDTEVGVKYRFFQRKGDQQTLAIGVYPMYQLATGARRLGPDRGTHGVFLPLWVQFERGGWIAYGGGGYRINRGAGARNSVFDGMTLLRQISDALQLGVEVFHETPTAEGGKPARGFNVGGGRVLTRRMNLLFSVGRIVGDTPANLFYLGLQVHF